MDAEQAKHYLDEARHQGRFRKLLEHPDWEVMDKFLHRLLEGYDTVRGTKSDKEWIRRQSAVEVLDTIIQTVEQSRNYERIALDKMKEDSED